MYRESKLLDDSKTLAELKLENDSVVSLAYQVAGERIAQAIATLGYGWRQHNCDANATPARHRRPEAACSKPLP